MYIKTKNLFSLQFEIAVSNEKFKDQLILDFDFENNIPLVSVHKSLASKLKSHQVIQLNFSKKKVHSRIIFK